MKTKPPTRRTSDDLLQMLRVKYPAESHALLPQCPIATGFACNGWADALVMGLWKSRGIELAGFEIKISRGDWLRELKNPAKAESFVLYCDRWWIVAADESIVREGELPPTWGLMVAKGRGLVVKTAAPSLTPKPIDRKFLAGLLRAAAEAVAKMPMPKVQVVEKIVEVGDAQTLHRTQQSLEALQKSVADFEKASGVRIDHWRGPRIGAAVRAVLDYGPEVARNSLTTVAQQFERMAAEVRRTIEKFEAETKEDKSC